MQQSPESPEAAGENAAMHLPPELQRIVHQFAQPVFRRCGRHLHIAETLSSNGSHQGFTCTKIGADERRSYPAIVNRPMAPDTGVHRWTWVVRRSPTGVVMPGVCTEDADPKQHSLRFRPHGAAYEPWTGLFYDFHQSNRAGQGPDRTGAWSPLRQGDEIAFTLDTHQGELKIYHSYQGGCAHIMRGLRGATLYAYCGLEKPGDEVGFIEIDDDIDFHWKLAPQCCGRAQWGWGRPQCARA